MGLAISGLLSRLFSKKPMRLLMLGLDNVGKTTILYQFKLGEMKTTTPTIGFNVESVEYKNLSFTIWDVGGGSKAPGLWKHYFPDTQAVIFVVDSTDKVRIREVYEHLELLLQDDELRNATLLVFANKQDLPDAMTTEDIVKELHLDKLPEYRIWHIQSATATKGLGLYEGFDWLSDELSKK